MIFIISMMIKLASGEAAIRSARTTNPAKAFSIAKSVVANNLPCNITLWLEVENDFYIPYNHIVNSSATLERAFQLMTSQAAQIIQSNQLD